MTALQESVSKGRPPAARRPGQAEVHELVKPKQKTTAKKKTASRRPGTA
ncbi:hypothetical protein ACWEWG_35750 [Streptomyces sp. NPDC003758]|uniref:Uncharacterized protein n=1 Tax=Streptomyces cynarae TaxID=2981134 RepID=A0ABY6ECY8_9ACTN|nr:hypothetical protein [Streptomyces cynarae]UXY24243.1 hypothetical protein N8I84_40420 [Streptomyces cynarae]